MTVLLTSLCLALGASFLCSLLEAVLLSVTHSYVNVRIRKGRRTGLILKKLKDNLDRPLSAILTLNTVAHTVGAAVIGAQVLKLYGDRYVALASAILTVLILVLSEIIPKTIGAAYWRQFAKFAAYTIQLLIFLTYPLVVIFEKFSRLFSKEKFHPKITREEIISVAEIGEHEGTLQEKETRVIRNLLQLNSVLAREVMTPTKVIFTLQKDQKVGEVVDLLDTTFFSRIPIYDKGIDDVVGLVFRQKIFQAASDHEDARAVESLMTEIHAVYESDSVATVLDLFIKRREHLFLVKNRHEKTTGIITLEDAIETLLGVEIADEADEVEDHNAADGTFSGATN